VINVNAFCNYNFAATEKTLLLQSDLKEASKNEKNISAFDQEKKK